MKNLKKMLITGGDGYVGSNLVSYFTSTYDVFPLVITSKKLDNEVVCDITERDKIQELVARIKPDIIIHTAALSSLKACEENPEQSYKINVEGTKHLVDIAKKLKVKLIFLSSDYIFDGKKGNYKETDKPNPATVYGKNKLEAENYIKENLENYVIIRTANVFGRGGNFFNFVVDSLNNKERIDVFTDVYFTPTYIDFLIQSINELLEIDFDGTIHVTGKDRVSRYQFAVEIAKAAGLDSSLIVQSSLPKGSLILTDSSLNTEKLSKKLRFSSFSIQRFLNYNFGNIIKPYFQFKDDRGSINGIINRGSWEEINYLQSIKGCTRGNHYHKRTREGFYIISGSIKVRLQELDAATAREFIVKKADIFIIEPKILHTFDILEDSEWINMLSESMREPKDIFQL